MNLPRKALWIEASECRVLMTASGPMPVYKGEFVMVVAGRTLEECQRLFCDQMLRMRGEFSPDGDK